MSSHTDASKCLHFIHNLYIHFDNTSIFLHHKTTDLIVPEVLIPLLYPLFFCSMSLATYQTQRKIKTSQKLLATEYFSPPFPSVLLPEIFPMSILALRSPSLPPKPLSFQQSSDFLLPTSVASSRSFSKSLSAVPIRFPIRRHIKQTPSMSAAMQNPLSNLPFQKINNSSCRIKAKAAAMQQTA
jgi:hypothetical protein